MSASAIPRDEFFESMLGDFLDESGQLLASLNENMLQLDEWFRSLDDADPHHCDRNLLNEMFRSAHSLKGLSAMLGLNDINHLTHKIENVFDAARKDELPLNCDVVELMFRAIDRLSGLVEVLKDPNGAAADCTDVLDGIHNLLAVSGVERVASSQADAENALNQLMATQSAPPPESETDAEENSTPSANVPTTPVAENAVSQTPAAASSSRAADVDYFADVADETELQSKYVSIFIDETELSLDNLTEVLLALEQHGQHAAIEQLLMTSHRIKGSAASVGLNYAAKMAHLMEDLMQDFSLTGRALTPKIIDALLACIDGLRVFVDSLKRGQPQNGHFNALARQLMASHLPDDETEAATPSEVTTTTEACATDFEANAPTTTQMQCFSTAEIAADSHAAPTDIDDELRRRVQAAVSESQRESTLIGIVALQPKLPLAGLKGRLLYERLVNVGEIRYFSPNVDQLEELEELAFVEFGAVTEKSPEAVRQLLRAGGVTKIVVQPLVPRSPTAGQTGTTPTEPPIASPAARPSASDASDQEAAASCPSSADKPAREPAVETATSRPAKTAADAGKPTETLRVDIERLDHLMNLAGQLVINRARFQQIADKLKKTLGGRQSRNVLNNVSALLAKIAEPEENNVQHGLNAIRGQARRIQDELEDIRRDVEALSAVRTSVNDLFETIHLLDRVTDGIQQSVMDTRMLPIGPLFQRFKRVVRDISRSNGKDICLVINGEKTELDKRMIDELGDPLIHMVRNSADHGIEAPEVRLAARKPAQGTVTLDAFHRGNSIFVRISDDGKGLDAERIKAKAVEKGLISPADAERMTNAQAFQLIWEPGLSTAEKVTEVSGRGMGMDIVKSKIESLNGTIELDSEFGRGTTVTIKLPLTLAILPSLMVAIDNDVFAMPLESVSEIISVAPQDICTVHRRPTARVRGRVISMVELANVFSWHERADRSEVAAPSQESPPCTLVIINENGRELGLAVDHVIGEQDIVIKSMAENYRNVQGIAGASILGDGRVSLILDVATLIDMATYKKMEV
jgi:two-component system, chemotaxis family, sensor kinase CheA